MDLLSSPLSEYERSLLEQAARWPGFATHTELTEAAIRQVTAHRGIDFATTLLYDRLTRSPVHGPFLKKIQRLPASAPAATPTTVLIVPGAFYRKSPHSGADGRVIREEAERLGHETELLPLTDFGQPRANARILRDWLERDGRESIILVSMSKGGAEVRIALDEPGAPETFRRVAFWINLSGLLHGSALVGWLFARRWRVLWFRLLFWLRGFEFSALPELARGPGTLLGAPLRLPEHLRTIHVVGFPLARHLSTALARRCHRRVESLGPSDGAGLMLSDVNELPGLIFPIWGTDHYLRPGAKDMRGLMRQVLHYVSLELDGTGEGGGTDRDSRKRFG